MDRNELALSIFTASVAVDHRCNGPDAAVRAYELADDFLAEAERQNAAQELKKAEKKAEAKEDKHLHPVRTK